MLQVSCVVSVVSKELCATFVLSVWFLTKRTSPRAPRPKLCKTADRADTTSSLVRIKEYASDTVIGTINHPTELFGEASILSDMRVSVPSERGSQRLERSGIYSAWPVRICLFPLLPLSILRDGALFFLHDLLNVLMVLILDSVVCA